MAPGYAVPTATAADNFVTGARLFSKTEIAHQPAVVVRIARLPAAVRNARANLTRRTADITVTAAGCVRAPMNFRKLRLYRGNS